MNDHPDTSPTQDTIDIQCNPNIRRLTVRTRILPQRVSYLKYLLSRLSAPNIQQITFEVLLVSPKRKDWQGWNEVDDVLAGVKFRGLREVAIVMNSDQNMGYNVRQHLTDLFPSMYDRGILNIIVPSEKCIN